MCSPEGMVELAKFLTQELLGLTAEQRDEELLRLKECNYVAFALVRANLSQLHGI